MNCLRHRKSVQIGIGDSSPSQPIRGGRYRHPLGSTTGQNSKGGAMSLQRVAWWAVWALAYLPALAFAQSSSCPGMHVQVLNIRHSTGTVDCALFESPEGFPTEALRSATNVMVIKVRQTQARCDFAA